MAKRMANRNNIQRSSTNQSFTGNYSPPGSGESDSSSSSHSTSSNPFHSQLCICPMTDCVIHDRRRSTNIPVELTATSNPTYGNNNLLLYYAHLERCRRYGQTIHQHTCSS